MGSVDASSVSGDLVSNDAIPFDDRGRIDGANGSSSGQESTSLLSKSAHRCPDDPSGIPGGSANASSSPGVNPQWQRSRASLAPCGSFGPGGLTELKRSSRGAAPVRRRVPSFVHHADARSRRRAWQRLEPCGGQVRDRGGADGRSPLLRPRFHRAPPALAPPFVGRGRQRARCRRRRRRRRFFRTRDSNAGRSEHE